MPLGQSNKKKSIASALVGAFASMFSKVFIPQKFQPHRPSKYRTVGKSNPAGNKRKRAIRRGNHGVVHKSGTIGRAIAEDQREQWLRSKNKPIIALSTH